MTKNAFVLLTAMPPTKGHKRLMEFASDLAGNSGGFAGIIVCTQPGEPFVKERFHAVWQAGLSYPNVVIENYCKEIQQAPADEDDTAFWEMWRDILVNQYGINPGDYIVASEPYGAKLAEITGGIFMPFDPNRQLTYSRATTVRDNPRRYFDMIMPEFQKYMQMTVTLFGAESTGKTTLSKSMAEDINGHWLFEYARPYLETVGPEITTESMTAIWRGQLALQQSARHLRDKPFIIQDTDLFSTVGYWDFWDMNTPAELVKDATANKSDLYLIPQSNIPFEADPIRYGGDKRESTDQYWINLCERYGLNYVVLSTETRLPLKEWEAELIVTGEYDKKFKFDYVREGQ